MEQNTEIRIGKAAKIEEKTSKKRHSLVYKGIGRINRCMCYVWSWVDYSSILYTIQVCVFCVSIVRMCTDFLPCFISYFGCGDIRIEIVLLYGVWPRPGHRMRYKTKFYSRCTYFQTKRTAAAIFQSNRVFHKFLCLLLRLSSALAHSHTCMHVVECS